MLSQEKKVERRPNLSVLVLVSFAVSFLVARAFTTLNPSVVLKTGGYHIHHFWYGILMMAVGGWLGISYNDERIDRLAAVIFGAGGGFIGDEAGLLLTFGDYWTGITYDIVIVFVVFVSVLILMVRYSRIIRKEFSGFTRNRGSFCFGVFLAVVSVAFLIDTDNIVIVLASSVGAVMAGIVILSYLVQRITLRRRLQRKG